MKNPIQRTKQGNVSIGTSETITRQGTVPLAQTTAVSVEAAPKGRQQVKGKGAMLRATTFSVR